MITPAKLYNHRYVFIKSESQERILLAGRNLILNALDSVKVSEC